VAYEILVHHLAAQELENVRVFDRRRIVAAIEKRLKHQPTSATRSRKCLVSLTPGFEHLPPVWELKVGDFRVFYDVDSASRVVHVRAVRRKTAAERTEEIT